MLSFIRPGILQILTTTVVESIIEHPHVMFLHIPCNKMPYITPQTYQKTRPLSKKVHALDMIHVKGEICDWSSARCIPDAFVLTG